MKISLFYSNYWKTKTILEWLLIFIVLPLILISFFNNPATDDFYYAFYSEKYSPLGAAKWMYFNNGGRYFSDTLLCFDPIYFNVYFPFKILPIILIGFFIFSTFYLFKQFGNTEGYYKLALIFLILYFTLLPDVCMNFYWMPGAITYQLPITLTLLFFAFLCRYYNDKKSIFLILSILLLGLILGTNQIIPIYMFVILGFTFCVLKFGTKRMDKVVLILLFFTILFGIFEFIAPGNFTRLSQIKGEHQLLHSFFKSTQFVVDCLFKWTPLVLIFNLFILKYSNDFLSNNLYVKYLINPLYAFILLLIFLFLGSFPLFWSTNTNIIPSRVTNFVFFFYLISMQYFIFCFLYYLKIKFGYMTVLNKSLRPIFILIVIIFSFSITPSYIAYTDLFTMKAYGYHNEIRERFKLLTNSKKDTVYIEPLIKKPATLYNEEVMGLTNNPKNWKNEEFRDYFKKVIITVPKDSTIAE